MSPVGWMRYASKRAIPLVAALIAAAPAAAQQAAADTTLAARMHAFLREVGQEPNTRLAEEFFPRRGDWTWVQEIRDTRGENPRTGIRRFAGAEAVRVIGAGGPACGAFDTRVGDIGPWEGAFGMQARRSGGPWRRVRGTRFVPPGASARSPVFVEWRREDGRWVVSAFGDEGFPYAREPRLLGRSALSRWRDTSLVPEDAAFAPADWHTVTLDGLRYSKYGSPRPIAAAELERIGVLGRVSVYVERGTGPRPRGIVYIPVAPGQLQPYKGPYGEPCR